MRIPCDRCNQLAVWEYGPGHHNGENYFCEDHVPSRGCSCNVYGDITECPRDNQGREYPCCEYMYSEEGFDDD